MGGLAVSAASDMIVSIVFYLFSSSRRLASHRWSGRDPDGSMVAKCLAPGRPSTRAGKQRYRAQTLSRPGIGRGRAAMNFAGDWVRNPDKTSLFPLYQRSAPVVPWQALEEKLRDDI